MLLVLMSLTCFSDEDTEIEGSLGGLQLLDLTQEDVKHQKVLSVGLDPDHLDGRSGLPVQLPLHMRPEMYKTAHESFLMDVAGTDNALSFTFHKPAGKMLSSSGPRAINFVALSLCWARKASLSITIFNSVCDLCENV